MRLFPIPGVIACQLTPAAPIDVFRCCMSSPSVEAPRVTLILSWMDMAWSCLWDEKIHLCTRIHVHTRNKMFDRAYARQETGWSI